MPPADHCSANQRCHGRYCPRERDPRNWLAVHGSELTTAANYNRCVSSPITLVLLLIPSCLARSHPQYFPASSVQVISHIVYSRPFFINLTKNVIPAEAGTEEDERYVASSKGEITRHHFVVSYSLATLQVYCPAFCHPHWWWRSSSSSLPPKNNPSSSSSSLQRFSRFVGSYAVTSPHVYWWSLSYLSNRKHSIIHQTAIPSRFTTATFDCSLTFSQTLSHIFNIIHHMDHFSFLLILLGYFFLFLPQSIFPCCSSYVFSFFQSSWISLASPSIIHQTHPHFTPMHIKSH